MCSTGLDWAHLQSWLDHVQSRVSINVRATDGVALLSRLLDHLQTQPMSMLAFPTAQVVPGHRGPLQPGRNAKQARAAKPLPTTFARVRTIFQRVSRCCSRSLMKSYLILEAMFAVSGATATHWLANILAIICMCQCHNETAQTAGWFLTLCCHAEPQR